MAKIIKLTPEYLEEVRADFELALQGMKLADGKINFTKTFGTINRKATVFFTEMAWQKMQALVREFDKEVAWHGVARRGEDPEKDEYIISDILVYPQEVTGATVTTDQVKYQMWLYDDENDAVFNDIRMQGHSHVNMSTTPSGVDTSLYERILDQMDDSTFYIFLIYNKRGEYTYKIYDMAKNVLFETADVTVQILGNGFDMQAFLKDAKSKVVNKPTYVGGYQYGAYDYGNRPYVLPAASKPAVTTPATAAKPVVSAQQTTSKQDDVKKNSSKSYGSTRKSDRKRGRRRGSAGNKSAGVANLSPKNACTIYDADDYDGFDDDPYGPFGYRDRIW